MANSVSVQLGKCSNVQDPYKFNNTLGMSRSQCVRYVCLQGISLEADMAKFF